MQYNRPDSIFIEDQEELEKILESSSIETYHEDIADESLHDILDSLPEKYREVLTLYYLGGMDSVEIAKAIGTSPATVRQRLSRARIQLREEALVMMGETFNQQKLEATFTFRIVEAVKRIRINPVPTMKGLPWGLSLAAGIMIAVMSLNPYMHWFSQIGTYARSVLPSETKVLKVGEIPVDVVKTSNITILSNNMRKGKVGEPKQPDENAFFMAPQGEGGKWVKKADIPTARWRSCASVVNGKIYVIGGSTLLKVFSTVEEYDPITNTWARKADMPTARSADQSNCVVNGKIYVIGGYNNDGYLSIVEEYNPGTNTWTRRADMPTPRGDLATGVVNGKIYVIGGAFPDQGTFVSAVEEYDPVADKWIKKRNMPFGRAYLSAAVVNGKIYAIGGGGNGIGGSSVVEEYDPMTDKWTKKADMPTPRDSLSTSVLNGKIYVLGGNDGHELSTAEEYDPAKDAWAKETDIPTARAGSSSAVINGRIYVISGATIDPNNPGFYWDEGLLPTVEEYTPEGWPFAVSSDGKLPSKWGKLKSR